MSSATPLPPVHPEPARIPPGMGFPLSPLENWFLENKSALLDTGRIMCVCILREDRRKEGRKGGRGEIMIFFYSDSVFISN